MCQVQSHSHFRSPLTWPQPPFWRHCLPPTPGTPHSLCQPPVLPGSSPSSLTSALSRASKPCPLPLTPDSAPLLLVSLLSRGLSACICRAQLGLHSDVPSGKQPSLSFPEGPYAFSSLPNFSHCSHSHLQLLWVTLTIYPVSQGKKLVLEFSTAPPGPNLCPAHRRSSASMCPRS